MTTIVTRRLLPVDQRSGHANDLFGVHFVLQLEPAVFNFASMLSPDYGGGYWGLYELGNGGFYMAPQAEAPFNVSCTNGFKGQLSADALGIAVCLYAYSHLSFTAKGNVAEVYAQQYHLLRDYMMEHAEVAAILGATD